MRDYKAINDMLIKNIRKLNDMINRKQARYCAVVEITTYKPTWFKNEVHGYDMEGTDEQTETYMIDCSDCEDKDEALSKGSDFGAEMVLNHDEEETGRCIEYEVTQVIEDCGYIDRQHVTGEFNELKTYNLKR